MLVCSHMVQKSLRNEDATKVLFLVSSGLYQVSDSVYNINKSLTSVGTLLRDDNGVRMCLESALDGQMRGVSTHKSDEIPVLNG